MLPYAIKEGIVSPDELDLTRKIAQIIQALPDVPIPPDLHGTKQEVSCHMLVRAIHALYPELQVQDGFYHSQYPHSWLLTPTGNVLDVYPVAGASGPLLLAGGEASPVLHLYTRKRYRYPFSRTDGS